MSALEQMSSSIDTQGEESANPLGSLASGASILAKAMQSYPELAEAADMIATMGGDEQGMSGGESGGTYTGTVDFLGTQVEIKDGIGDIEGNKIYVSPDGAVVADNTGKIMGRVENGKFAVIDKNQATNMESKKMAERRDK